MLMKLSAEGVEIQFDMEESDLRLCLKSPVDAGIRLFGPAMRQLIHQARPELWAEQFPETVN